MSMLRATLLYYFLNMRSPFSFYLVILWSVWSLGSSFRRMHVFRAGLCGFIVAHQGYTIADAFLCGLYRSYSVSDVRGTVHFIFVLSFVSSVFIDALSQNVRGNSLMHVCFMFLRESQIYDVAFDVCSQIYKAPCWRVNGAYAFIDGFASADEHAERVAAPCLQ